MIVFGTYILVSQILRITKAKSVSHRHSRSAGCFCQDCFQSALLTNNCAGDGSGALQWTDCRLQCSNASSRFESSHSGDLLIDVSRRVEGGHFVGRRSRLRLDAMEGARKQVHAGRGDDEEPGDLEDGRPEINDSIVFDGSALRPSGSVQKDRFRNYWN